MRRIGTSQKAHGKTVFLIYSPPGLAYITMSCDQFTWGEIGPLCLVEEDIEYF